MNDARLAKIRALASDPRGDPAIRAIAQSTLKRFGAPEKEEPRAAKPWRDPRHPGVKTSAEYDRFRFMDLGSWRQTENGNPTFTISLKGHSWRVVLFKHKKRPTYGWMLTDAIYDKPPEFSHPFETMAEAHEDVWRTLNKI
jgi:hypothetical protein